MRRAERHARAESDEDRAEQHTVCSVAAAQARGEDLAGSNHHATRGEGADESDDESADEPRMADEARALTQQGQQARLVINGAASPATADLGDEQDDQRADQERRCVEVEGQVRRVGLEKRKVPSEHVGDQRQDREQRRPEHRREPVGRDQAELVGRLDLVAADKIRHRRVLRRRPEQTDALDQEARDVQPGERLALRHEQMREWNREEQPEPEHVGDDHGDPSVEPVSERTGQRAQQYRGQQADDQDAAEGVVLLPDSRWPATWRARSSQVVPASRPSLITPWSTTVAGTGELAARCAWPRSTTWTDARPAPMRRGIGYRPRPRLGLAAPYRLRLTRSRAGRNSIRRPDRAGRTPSWPARR